MSSELPSLGVLGLGIVGSRCAANLKQAGIQTLAWNRSERGSPVEQVKTPAELARRSRVLAFYLKDSEAVLETFGALASELGPDHVVINHATIDLSATKQLAAACAEIGCGFLDCPFTGSRDAAAAGQLVYYCGGDPQLLEAMRSVLEITSKEIQYLGGVGAATTIKLATNLVSACVVQALAEGLALTCAQGLDGQLFVDAIGSNACGSKLSAMKLRNMISAEFEPHFSLENMRKDSAQMLRLAQSSGLDLPAIQAVNQAMSARCEAGDSELDFSALARKY